jgi:predicted metal-dependent phosphoesterase TrpH
MFVDLHIHSIFSDSTNSPEDIARIAKEKQVSLLSICDHFTFDSYDRLADACKKNNITCVTGIELDANLHEKNYHVLVYNFDIKNQSFINFIERQKEKSKIECEKMIERMSKDYPQCSLAEFINYKPPIESGGWKYMHYIVEKELFKTHDDIGREIFQKYFKAGEGTFSIEDFCDVAKQAGGIPVLAHPGNLEPEELTLLLHDMQDRGIEGVECYYPSHSKSTTEICLDYCHRNNMRITSGSDCHGEYDKTVGFAIGSLKTKIDMLDLKGIF